MSKSGPAPAEIAIALHYSGTGAPRVTARGKGFVAEEILNLAKKHAIPVRTEPELVNLLVQVKLGHEIPENLYVAIAEILAFAYRLKHTPVADRITKTRPAQNRSGN
jgi:flagellar biosynthesis protein